MCVGRREEVDAEIQRMWLQGHVDSTGEGERSPLQTPRRSAAEPASLKGGLNAADDMTHRETTGGCMAVLSVRSGLHLLCSSLDLPRGSEVLISALNIPDVPAILEHHGLVCVPVDIDLDTLAVNADAMAAAVTPQTRAVLVAHVYGARANMAPIIACAEHHRLLVIEDCAEAFDGLRYRGHPRSDAVLFSFGPIKFGSVFQGGLLRVRAARWPATTHTRVRPHKDAEPQTLYNNHPRVLQVRDAQLFRRLRRQHAMWPVQGRFEFLWRCLKFLVHDLPCAPAATLCVSIYRSACRCMCIFLKNSCSRCSCAVTHTTACLQKQSQGWGGRLERETQILCTYSHRADTRPCGGMFVQLAD